MKKNALKNRVLRARQFLKLYRLISLLIVASLVMVSVPPVIAAPVTRNAFSNAKARARSLGSRLSESTLSALEHGPMHGPYGFLVSSWARSLRPAKPISPQRAPHRGVRPRSETRAESELRVARLKVNPSGNVRLQSRQQMLFTAIPTDPQGNSIHGLEARWVSSNSQVLFIKPSGHGVAGLPGKATLTATAGPQTATIEVFVTESSTREKFGAKKPTSTRRAHGPKSATVTDGAPPNIASVKTARQKRTSRSRSAFKHHDSGTTALMLPQQSPEDPLPDDETYSLYEPGNIVGSPPGKTKPGAKTLAVATDGTETNGSQNFTFALPIVGLAGRGLDVSLSLVYNSQLWNKSIDSFIGSTWMTYDVDSSWTGPGFRLGFGQIEDQGSFGFTLTEPDGTRRALVLVSGTTFETTDGSFIRYVGGGSSGTLYYPDGTIVFYGAGGGGYRIYPTKITDRNGNFILISYTGTNNTGPKISSIHDTLNRWVNFHYASNGDLVTITAPGLGETDLQMMRFYYTDVTLGSSLFDSSVNAIFPESVRALQYVYLPTSADGTDPHTGYKFEYSPYGMIRQVTQFRGMTVSSDSETSAGTVTSEGTMAAQTTYGYPTSGQSLTDVPKYDSRTDDWAGRTTSGSAPSYAFSNTTGTGEKISTITAPDGAVAETHAIDNPGNWNNGLVKRTLIKYGSTVLSDTQIDWEDPGGGVPPRVAAVRVTDDGSTARTKATVLSYTSYNNVSVVSERDFTTDGSISSTELRRTETTYVTSSGYINRRLLHLIESVKVFPGGSSTPASRTDLEYDNYGTNHANLMARNDIIKHDEAYDPFQEDQETCLWVCHQWDYMENCIDLRWDCSYYNPYVAATDYRGNVTSVTTYTDAANATGAITNSTTYDIAGNVMTAEVDCCQLKSFTYSGVSSGKHDYAYVISVTDGNPTGLHLTTSTDYNYNTGLVATTTDANSQVTTNYYNTDSLRLDYTTYPDGGAVYFTYGDGLAADANGEYHSNIQTSTKLDTNGSGGATRYVDSFQYLDGRGAVARTLSNYTSTNGWYTQDTEYDNLGRAYRASNPYYSSGPSSTINPDGFWTTSSFDRLGRVDQVNMPRGDNNNALLTSISASYDGIYTTITDQAGKLRRQKVDSLGRVIRLDEPTTSGLGAVDSPNQATNYYYDTLDNLVHINQGDQHRYFKFDSVSRLIRERQVEHATNPSYDLSDAQTGNGSWSRKFEYNSHGLITNGYDARGVQTSFSYDGLNRVTAIDYSDSTPDAFYYYDNQTLPDGAPSYTHSNTSGRLLAMTYGSNTSITGNYFAYDSMGRVTTQKQVTGSTTYGLSYSYNHAGMLTGETYPSNRALSYSYDEGGRLSQVSDGVTTFASGFQFAEHGGLKSETFGNGMVHGLDYNRRLQAKQVTLKQNSSATTPLQQYDYGYGTFNSTTGSIDTSKNNSQIGIITGKINGTTQWLQGFIYDELGRLSNTTEYVSGTVDSQSVTYSQSYTYDRHGNRFQSANTTLGLPAVTSSEIAAATNRFVDTGSTPTTYDAAGNITIDTKFRNLKYEYDANGRQTAAKLQDNTTIQTSVYDCGGQRVQTSGNGVTRTMVYDVFGQNVADYTGSSPTLDRENIYRGGQLLATETAVTAAPSALVTNPSASNVALSWSAASGATNYRVERKAAGGSYSSIGTSTSTSFTDSSAAVGSAYLYKICAADGGGNCTSGYTNLGLGARLNFPTDSTITSIADDPTGATVTTMKAAHITELRTAVNAVRSLAGQSAATWTHSSIATGDTIYKDDVQDLRDKLHDALIALGIQTSAYTDSTLAGAPNGTLIKAAHIRELRERTTKGTGTGGGGTSGGLHYVLSDIQGSTRAVMSNNGTSSAIIARHDYLPFGEEVGSGTGLRTSGQGYGILNSNRLKYGLTERDSTSGLDHTWWRKYENLGGRWTTPDPYIGSMTITRPQSFNRYAYVQNDPVNSIDPTGLDDGPGPAPRCPEGTWPMLDAEGKWQCAGVGVLKVDAKPYDPYWDQFDAAYSRPLDMSWIFRPQVAPERQPIGPVRSQDPPEVRRRIAAGQAWERWRQWNACATPIKAKFERQRNNYLREARNLEMFAAIVGGITIFGLTNPMGVAMPVGQILNERMALNLINENYLEEVNRTCGPEVAKPRSHN